MTALLHGHLLRAVSLQALTFAAGFQNLLRPVG